MNTLNIVADIIEKRKKYENIMKQFFKRRDDREDNHV